MASPKRARLAEMRSFLAERSYEYVGEPEFAELCVRFEPARPDVVRKWLRECGAPLAPSVEGVRQENFEELARTLNALTGEYERSDRERARAIRRLVITAKDHARLAGRATRDARRRAVKEEMAQWMLVWLENPPLFPQWVRVRSQVSSRCE